MAGGSSRRGRLSVLVVAGGSSGRERLSVLVVAGGSSGRGGSLFW